MIVRGVPWSLLLGAGALGAVVIVILYTIRWRLPNRRVATVALWVAAVARKRGTGRLGTLEQLPSLILQLVIFGCLLAAAAELRFGFQHRAGRTVFVVLDRSSSMATSETIEPRLDTARRRAKDWVQSAAEGDQVGLVLAGGAPEIAAPLSRDLAHIESAISRVRVRTGPGRLADAVAQACGLLEGSEEPLLVVVTDGSEPLGSCSRAALEVIQVGTAHANMGITAFAAAVTRGPTQRTQAFIEVTNSWTRRASGELRIDVDGSLVRVSPIELEPDATLRRSFADLPLGKSGRLTARIDHVRFEGGGTDALHDDDVAYAVVERPNAIDVDLVGESVPLRLVLAANPRFRVTARASLAEAHAPVVVVTGAIDRPLPPGRYLLVQAHGPGAPVTENGSAVDEPRITFWRAEHPVLRHVVLSDVLVAHAAAVTLPSAASALVGSGETPLVYAFNDGRRKAIGFTFELETSNLPLRVGFPVLVYNAIDWLLDGRDGSLGDPLTIRTTSPVEVRTAGQPPRTLEPVDGQVTLSPEAPGFYQVVTPGGQPITTLAVSTSDQGETRIQPAAGSTSTAGSSRRLRDGELSVALLLVALGLLCTEWFLFHRRVTV